MLGDMSHNFRYRILLLGQVEVHHNSSQSGQFEDSIQWLLPDRAEVSHYSILSCQLGDFSFKIQFLCHFEPEYNRRNRAEISAPISTEVVTTRILFSMKNDNGKEKVAY